MTAPWRLATMLRLAAFLALLGTGETAMAGSLGGPLERLGTIVPQLVIDRLRIKRDDPSHPLSKLARDQHIE